MRKILGYSILTGAATMPFWSAWMTKGPAYAIALAAAVAAVLGLVALGVWLTVDK